MVIVDDKKRHRTEAEEWCFRLMNDPEQFEKWRYIDTINDYSGLIAEFQTLYEHTCQNTKWNEKNQKETWQKLGLNTRCARVIRPGLR